MFVVSWVDENGENQRRIMEVTRDNEYDRKFFFKLLCEGFAGFSPDGEPGQVLLARIFGRLRKHPSLAWEIPAFCANRALQERQWIPSFLSAFSRGRFWQIKPFVIVIHNFMSEHELQTETGKQRLEACAFRIPIDVQMKSMCEVNGKMRTDLNIRDQERLVQLVKSPVSKKQAEAGVKSRKMTALSKSGKTGEKCHTLVFKTLHKQTQKKEGSFLGNHGSEKGMEVGNLLVFRQW